MDHICVDSKNYKKKGYAMDFFANDNDITFIKTSIANMTRRKL